MSLFSQTWFNTGSFEVQNSGVNVFVGGLFRMARMVVVLIPAFFAGCLHQWFCPCSHRISCWCKEFSEWAKIPGGVQQQQKNTIRSHSWTTRHHQFWSSALFRRINASQAQLQRARFCGSQTKGHLFKQWSSNCLGTFTALFEQHRQEWLSCSCSLDDTNEVEQEMCRNSKNCACERLSPSCGRVHACRLVPKMCLERIKRRMGMLKWNNNPSKLNCPVQVFVAHILV